MAVKAIPDTYTGAVPYLTIKEADKALDFYKKVFGAEEKTRYVGPNGKIFHAEMRIGRATIYMTEEHLEFGARSPTTTGGTSTSVILFFEDVDAVAAKVTAAGCSFMMPVSNMFWGDRSGCFIDPFGHSWMIQTHIEDVTSEQMAQRANEAFANPECNK